MKRVIAAAAVLLAAFGMAAQAQAHGWDNHRPGWQDQGRHERSWRDNRPYANDRWRDRGRWEEPRRWHDRDDWRDRDDARWVAPRYHYYGRPYYGYGSRYYNPPVYRYGYYGDYDDCDDGDISLLLSLPLRF